MILETGRLILRAFQESDFEAVHAYGSDPEVVKYMRFGPNTEQETRDFLKRTFALQQEQPRSVFDFALVKRSDNSLIGGCGISLRGLSIGILDSKEAEIGYILNKSQWRQGYVSEAAARVVQFGFEELGLHRVFATCHPANIASYRVMEKIGMQREGYLREHMFVKGKWRDSLLYSILEQDWHTTRARK